MSTSPPKQMKEIRTADYLRFLSLRKSVRIEGKSILIGNGKALTKLGPPDDYDSEAYTVWSFPDRGDWATHNGEYRGNWSPYIPRNLIERFTSKGEWILDPMMGGGTTLVESKLLGRNAIGVDINLNAVILARDRLRFRLPQGHSNGRTEIKTYLGDARRLGKIPGESIDLIATHPPYSSIIRYGDGLIEGDLSELASFEEYLRGMGDVASECYRVLKKDRCCAILIGDTRKHRHFVPISYSVLKEFIEAGFVLLEDIIKVQHKTASDRGRWRGNRQGFYKIAHEHLFVFRKPQDTSELSKLKLSRPTVAAGRLLSNPIRGTEAASKMLRGTGP